jgi:tryptophan synthase alpha chain
MSRIAACFAKLRERKEKALVAFVTAGDPLPEATADIVVALAVAGADIVELGVPFSDPLADGPTIQASTQRALDSGVTPPRVLDIVRQIRERSDVPLVLMGAWNPVISYGQERFAYDAVAAGADGTIITDLTPEEAHDWKRDSDTAGLDTIFLLAPTSTAARMTLVAGMASGFLYCVSRTGVTGARQDVPADLPPLIEAIRDRAGDLPICVGFGIADPVQAKAICAYADGIVVGSALVELLHRERENPRLLEIAGEFIAALKGATKS